MRKYFIWEVIGELNVTENYTCNKIKERNAYYSHLYLIYTSFPSTVTRYSIKKTSMFSATVKQKHFIFVVFVDFIIFRNVF